MSLASAESVAVELIRDRDVYQVSLKNEETCDAPQDRLFERRMERQ